MASRFLFPSTGSNSTIQNQLYQINTELITNNSSIEQVIEIVPRLIINSISVSHSSRVRVYANATARAADTTRDVNTPPPEDLPILLDILFETDNLDYYLQFGRVWVNLDDPQTSNYYLTLQNTSGSDTSLTLTLTHTPF